jgi:hypothetical protein
VFGSAALAGEKVEALAPFEQISPSGGATAGALDPAAGPKPAPTAPDKDHEAGWLRTGLGLLGGAWDTAAGLVPERAKPMIREVAQRGLGVAIQVGSKILPDSVKDGALTKPEDALDWISRQVNNPKESSVPGPLQDAFRKLVPEKVREKIHKVTGDLAAVDLEDARNTEGLQADWYRLYEMWLTESHPGDPNSWDVSPEGHERLTITDPTYARDLETRPQHREALDAFFREHPNPQPGDTSSHAFGFTGDGTREGGSYTALEWYLGSYNTTVRYTGQDPNTGKAILDIEVSNVSDWASGTRLPGSQQIGGRNKILPETKRGGKLGIGGDFDQRFEWTQLVDLPPG